MTYTQREQNDPSRLLSLFYSLFSTSERIIYPLLCTCWIPSQPFRTFFQLNIQRWIITNFFFYKKKKQSFGRTGDEKFSCFWKEKQQLLHSLSPEARRDQSCRSGHFRPSAISKLCTNFAGRRRRRDTHTTLQSGTRNLHLTQSSRFSGVGEGKREREWFCPKFNRKPSLPVHIDAAHPSSPQKGVCVIITIESHSKSINNSNCYLFNSTMQNILIIAVEISNFGSKDRNWWNRLLLVSVANTRLTNWNWFE